MKPPPENSTEENILWYSKNAAAAFAQYEEHSFESVHACFMPYLDPEPGDVLDIGSGSGRDAAWLARINRQVFAVEPSDALRTLAESKYSAANIHWIKDALPTLRAVRESDTQFDLILLSGVWSQLSDDERQTSMQTLRDLLKPAGRCFISIRHGPPLTGRHQYRVPERESRALAEQFGLEIQMSHEEVYPEDAAANNGVHWTKLVLAPQ